MYNIKTGSKTLKDTTFVIDYSYPNEGYIVVTYTGDKNKHCKIDMIKGQDNIMYDINNVNVKEILPFIFGNGKYTIRVLIQASEPGKYAIKEKMDIEVKLTDPTIIYRYPNQRVNFSESMNCVKQANTLCANIKDNSKKLFAIYDFIVNNFSYDSHLANTVQPRYLPDCDRTLKNRKGICCDIASLFAAMCRSQGLVVQYVTGYMKSPDGKEPIYHAYNKVLINSDVNLTGGLIVRKNEWTLLDPTIAMSNKSNRSSINFIQTKGNYTDKHIY